MPTKIEWCDETINPVVGCSKCSLGCDNCYAEKFAARLAGNPNRKISGKYSQVVWANGEWNGRTVFNSAAFDRLPRGGKSVFLCSMGDVFHESVSQGVIDEVFNSISLGTGHRFLVLTKRAERMAAALKDLGRRWKSEVFGPGIGPAWPMPNVWLGVTVCNQREADEKIPHLLCTTAAHRFISVEPMLGPVDLTDYLQGCGDCRLWGTVGNRDQCLSCDRTDPETMGHFKHGLDCVICGGETGTNARPMHPDWVRSLRDQCAKAGVPFFFKGWGQYMLLVRQKDMPKDVRPFDYLPQSFDQDKWRHFNNYRPLDDGAYGRCWMLNCGKKLSGRLLDGVEHNERPW